MSTPKRKAAGELSAEKGDPLRFLSSVSPGRITSAGNINSVITLDPETFEQVCRLAHRSGVTFAEQVRTLIEWGLEAEQCEAAV